MKMVKIEKLIHKVTNKNKEDLDLHLYGVSMSKNFIDSAANIIGTDMTTYKIINKNQFACNPMHIGRDKILPVAIYKNDEPGLISPAFTIFEVNNENELLPEYLYLFLSTNLVDKYLWFKSDSSVRGSVDFEEICNMYIPLLDIDEQKSFVSNVHIIDSKINSNNLLSNSLSNYLNVLLREMLSEEDNAGVLWERKPICDLSYKISAGGDKPLEFSEIETEEYNIPVYSNGIDNKGLFGYTNVPKITSDAITISARGTIGYVCLRKPNFVPIVRLITIEPNEDLIPIKYLYMYLNNMKINGFGTTQQQLTVPEFKNTSIIIPPKEVYEKYQKNIELIFDKMDSCEIINNSLIKLKKHFIESFYLKQNGGVLNV